MRSWAAALLLLLLICVGRGGSGVSVALDGLQRSWIIVGKPEQSPGLPICRLCLNAFTGPHQANLTTYQKLQVGIYPCWAFESNEVWTFLSGFGNSMASQTGAIMMQDHANSSGPAVCITGVRLPYGKDDPFPFRLELRACNPVLQAQQWHLLDDGTVQSMIPWPQPLFIAGNSTAARGKYHLFLQPRGSLTSYFIVLPVDSYSYAAYSSTQQRLQVLDAVAVPVASDPDPTINIIRDGSFEHATVRLESGEGSFTIADRLTLFPIGSWQVVRDAEMVLHVNSSISDQEGDPLQKMCIEYVQQLKWTASSGDTSIHLSCGWFGYESAVIAQTLTLPPSSNFSLSFKLSGHPPSQYLCPNSNLRHLSVQLYNAVPQGDTDFTYDAGNNTPTTMHWTSCQLYLTTLDNPVVIAFSKGDTDSQCGPAIDDVTLNAVVSYGPDPSTTTTATGPGPPATRHSLLLSVIIPVSLSALLLGVAWCAMWFCRSIASKPKPPLSDAGTDCVSKMRPFTWKELDTATAGFRTRVGAGGYGVVYRATFPDGSLGAVKVSRVDPNKPKAKAEADVSVKEATILMRIHHRYLVNLIGYCTEAVPWPLVFEFLEGGSLFDRLHNNTPDNVLPWRCRMKVALQVSSALEYLHHGCNPQVLHRDVKSANVLLSKCGVAKLADFGLSKATSKASSMATSGGDNTSESGQVTLVRGSPGYIDPAYEQTGLCSAKSDVYSFGVLLLELVSGRPALRDGCLLTTWAAPWLERRAVADSVVDPRLEGVFYAPDLHLLLRLAAACVDTLRHARPTMTVVTRVLSERLQVSEPAWQYTTESPPQLALQSPPFQLTTGARMGNPFVTHETQGDNRE